jgi:putative spermidine/putrescine transport system ATP-binding protein
MAGAPAEFVRFNHVDKAYDPRTLVIRDLNLTVQPREFLTLLGPSGSGKTTTLMMLAGFEQPTGGEILLEGRPISREPSYRRNFGMVFQDYALFPHMTVFENVSFPLQVRRMSAGDISRRTKDMLAVVKLEGLGDRLPGQLSGGQQQRVALARALVFGPRLVLMDEPLGALDKQLREQLQLEIKHIQNMLGVAVIYVTHDQAEALVMSDRIAVFNNGIVHQVDTPAELYEHPTSAFVAQFVGENNQLHGTISGLDGSLCRVDLAGGGTLTALAVNVASVGTRTVVSIRPERIVLEPDLAITENVMAGHIEELIYRGSELRVRMKIGGDKQLHATVPIAHATTGLTVGRTIRVGCPAHNCRALRES